MQKNVVWHNTEITLKAREQQQGHQGVVLWFTGLSGSGKSTIATALEKRLFKMDCHTYILDGDNVRHGLNSDLDFSKADRQENIRRIGEVAKLFMDSGMITLTSFISPFRKDRQQVRDILPAGKFVEVYVKAPLDVCESRDPKGLYKKARAGKIQNFTGIGSPYEEPENPEITVDTFKHSVDQNVDEIVSYLLANKYINKK
ncbi:MAG: adenylyl-sulfate kinase [Fidelibacterota bacterium]